MSKEQLILLDLEKSGTNNLVPLEPKANPADPLGENWLKAMEVGTYFVSEVNSQKSSGSKYIMDEFCVLAHNQTTWLHYVNSNQRLRVNSLKFSRNNTLVEILGVITPDNKNDAEHNRTDNQERLEDNEKPPGVD